MNSFIEIANELAGRWLDGMWAVVWQSTALAVTVYLLTLCIRRASAAARFWLWMLVPLRLLAMPLITISLPLLPAVTQPQSTYLEPAPLLEVATASHSEIIPPETRLSTVEFRPTAIQIQNAEVVRSRARPDARTVLMALWLAGVSLCSVRLLLSLHRIRRIAAGATPVSDKKVLATAQRAAGMLKLKRMPRILVTNRNISPFLFGVLRPVLVAPAGLIANVNEEALYAVFAHEFAHLRRRDPLIGWILAVCETIYFFHPVLHFAKRRILFEREKACDNWVVVASKAKRSAYANALISAADACRGFSVKVGPVGAVAESFGDLKKRLLAISRNLKPRARLSVSALILLVIVGAICVPGIVLTARTSDESKGTDLQVEVGQGKQLVAMTILPRGPIRSLEDYYFAYQVRALVEEKLNIESVEMEIRSAGNASRAARIPITIKYIEELRDKNCFPGGSRGRIELDPRQRRLIGELSNGEYLVAVNVNGVRCSNVASLVIDSDFDASSEPALRLFPLPVESGRNLPYLGIRAVGPTPQDAQLKNDMIAFADLVVGGMIRRPKEMKWVGPVGPLKPGWMYTRILDLSNYEPEIEPLAQHEVKAIVGQYESAPVVIPADDSSGREWDKSTEKLPSIPPPRIALEGKVIGPDGKAAANYEVHLFGKNGERFSESSSRDGEYEFCNIPSGEYQLVCNPKGRGQPGLTIEQVGIDANEPLVLNLSLKRQYNFAGKVYYEDGKPAAKMDVALTCEDRVNNAEFVDFTTTDANGWYELGGPFISVSYIGVSGRRIQGPMPGLKPGPTELNYMLGKNKRGQAAPINQPGAKTDVQLDDGIDARKVELVLKAHPSEAAPLVGRSIPGSETAGRQSSSVSDKTPKAEPPTVSSSRAWYIMRQGNAGPLLLGLTQRLGKVIASGRRDTTLWEGVANGGSLEVDIATEGDVTGEIFVGFFKDAKWSAEPVQVRSFPQPGRYTISNLPPGKYQIGAMIGGLPVAAALGVRRTWPEPVEIRPQVTARAEVLVSEEFQKHASGWHNKNVSREFLGDWERLDGENLLQGHVTGPDGRPVPFAEVQVREYNPGASGIAAPDCGTSEQGFYKCDRIAWPYRVGVLRHEPIPSVLGYRHQYLYYNRVFEGSQTIDFRFDSFPRGDAKLNGRVIDQNGEPLTEFHIDVSTKMDWEVIKNPDSKFYKIAGYRVPFVSKDGTFELGGLPEGEVRVHVIPFQNQAYSWHRSEEIVLSGGETSTIELKVIAKNVLFGRVLFKDGSPAVIKPPRWKGAKTSILQTSRGMSMMLGAATVDDDGYFAVHLDEQEMAALRSGRVELAVHVPTAEERHSETVGKFPFELLSRDKSKAGVLEIEDPLGESPSIMDKSLPTFEGIAAEFGPERTKGKKVLVCFWDMQQRPSRNLVAELAKRRKELENRGVVVLLAHTSQVDADVLKQWLGSRRIPFTCGSITGDTDTVLFRWGVRAQPWLVLADEKGIVRAEGLALDQLDEKLNR